MAIMQYSIKTGHTCFNQQFCNTAITLEPPKTFLHTYYRYSKPPCVCLKGMNRLVAILLLFLDEECAFWGLVSIVESLMPAEYYDRTLIAAHADQVLSTHIAF